MWSAQLFCRARHAGTASGFGASQLSDLFAFGVGNEWRFAGPDGEQSIAVSGNLQANSDNALRLAAVHGQGLALAPTFLVADEVKSGRLVPVLRRFLQTEHSINAIYPHRHHLSAKVRSFIDLLAKHFRAEPAWADPSASCTAGARRTDGTAVEHHSLMRAGSAAALGR